MFRDEPTFYIDEEPPDWDKIPMLPSITDLRQLPGVVIYHPSVEGPGHFWFDREDSTCEEEL